MRREPIAAPPRELKNETERDSSTRKKGFFMILRKRAVKLLNLLRGPPPVSLVILECHREVEPFLTQVLIVAGLNLFLSLQF